MRRLRSQLPHEGRLWLDSSAAPVFTNRYLRRYLVSADGDIRITVDTDQAVWDQRRHPRPNLTSRARLSETVVVEVKFDRPHYARAAGVLHGFPVRVSRHSKYVNAVVAISGR